MESPSPTAPPAVAAAEDAVGSAGEAIDTFSSYSPTALPNCVIAALSDQDGSAGIGSPTSYGNEKTLLQQPPKNCEQKQGSEVIEILDSDDEDEPSSSCSQVTDQTLSTRKQLHLDTSIPTHSFPACESALLASVSAPRATEESGGCLVDLAKSKSLSPLQLEGATLAISRHNRLFYSPQTKQTVRAGFFLGDAAGIGKGRQIGAIIKDSLCRGRTRHLWISVSRELCEDAKRDLRDLNCYCDVHNGSDVLTTSNSKGLGSVPKRGVLFVTYNLLVSGKRMEEIISWLTSGSTDKTNPAMERSFSGLVVFDEAHKAKNLDADTQTAKRVVLLQERLPQARVLYASATGVSDISHMVYANRLGLWGPGSGLYPSFDSFQMALLSRGNRTSSLELLALEMKQAGMFVARTLSWEGAEFETVELELSPDQIISYNAAVEWWKEVRSETVEALKLLDMTTPPKTLWRAYWSAHQRFFREMCICAKIPSVASEAVKYMEQDYAIVVGLQSTGEAGTQCALEELGEQMLLESSDSDLVLKRKSNETIDFTDILMPNLLSTACSIMTNFVRNHFPVSLPPPEPPTLPPVPPNGFPNEAMRCEHMRLQAEAEHIKSLPPPLPLPQLVARQRALLDKARELELPPNPLDDLIDRLGGESRVAELTGRSGRILRYKEQQHFHFVKRTGAASKQKNYGLSMPQSSDEFVKLNIVEKKKFMDGRKSVAIISDAASTGISLHAAEGTAASHKRRVHFTIELPWAADKAIQQLGRSHRSGQMSAPIYKMVVTELGGERRFGAAVAKRMASLGALTKGDRRAATGSDLSEFDIDSVYGRRALNRFYQCVLDCNPPTTAPSRHSNVILDQYIEDASGEDKVERVKKESLASQRAHALLVARQALLDVGIGTNESAKKNAEVRVFLNRIAGLAVTLQNLVFSLFHSTLDDVIGDAKATGEFEGSVEEVKATTIFMEEEPEVIAIDQRSGAETTLIKLNLDRGISFEAAVATSQEGDFSSTPDEGSRKRVADSGFYVSRRKIAGRDLVLFAKRKAEPGDATGPTSAHDPLGLMVITRPNTGKNPCEMATKDLNFKYRLIVSSVGLHRVLQENNDGQGASKDGKEATNAIRSKYPHLARLWDSAYSDSDIFEYGFGLAPRRSRLGLITGAVLHVLPALERAVIGQRLADRALRVARIELTNTGQRLVGLRFPLDEEPLSKLKAAMTALSDARKCSSDGDAVPLFRDEDFAPVNDKSTAWVTTERKTMRSFFSPSALNGTMKAGSKRKVPPSLVPFSPPSRIVKSNIENGKSAAKKQRKTSKSKKEATNIKSFFGKK